MTRNFLVVFEKFASGAERLALVWSLNFSKVCYEVASISRLLKITGHFCKRALSKRRYSAKETYIYEKRSVKEMYLSLSCSHSDIRPVVYGHVKISLLLWKEICKREVQPIADRVAQHLEIISKNFHFSTRRTRILMGFIIYYLVLIVNPMGRILVRWKFVSEMISRCCATLSAIGCTDLWVSLIVIYGL